MPILLYFVMLAVTVSQTATNVVPERVTDSSDSNSQVHVHGQRLVNNVENTVLHNAGQLIEMVNSSVVDLEHKTPFLPSFQVLIDKQSIENKKKIILSDDFNVITTTTPSITTLTNEINENESIWETTTMDGNIGTTTTMQLHDEIVKPFTILTSTQTTYATTTIKTPLNKLKETEKELKEKIAEIEAEPLILSARV